MTVSPRIDPSALVLVAITDSLRDGIDGLVSRATAAVEGGATMVQLRLKDEGPRTLVEVARALLRAVPRVPVLVNDRADVALAAGVHGVHVGVDDLAPAALRRIVPPAFIIGASVGSDDEVERASEADYVGIGPVYPTASKGDAGSAIGVARFAEQCFGRANLHHSAKVHYRDTVRNMADKAQVMGHENHGQMQLFLQLQQQVDHLRLY